MVWIKQQELPLAIFWWPMCRSLSMLQVLWCRDWRTWVFEWIHHPRRTLKRSTPMSGQRMRKLLKRIQWPSWMIQLKMVRLLQWKPNTVMKRNRDGRNFCQQSLKWNLESWRSQFHLLVEKQGKWWKQWRGSMPGSEACTFQSWGCTQTGQKSLQVLPLPNGAWLVISCILWVLEMNQLKTPEWKGPLGC